MGLYLGWVFQASENLLAPILVHWIYDSVALYLLRREIKKEAAGRPEEEVSRS
jgi:membrane protease YdiL (CAAX protease family)